MSKDRVVPVGKIALGIFVGAILFLIGYFFFGAENGGGTFWR